MGQDWEELRLAAVGFVLFIRSIGHKESITSEEWVAIRTMAERLMLYIDALGD